MALNRREITNDEGTTSQMRNVRAGPEEKFSQYSATAAALIGIGPKDETEA
jgi:hypothetical protein